MTTTETTPITIINSVSFGSYADDTNLVSVELNDGRTACFHIHEDYTSIRILGFGGMELYKFRTSTIKAPSILAYALRNPDSFMEACQAFLTQKL